MRNHGQFAAKTGDISKVAYGFCSQVSPSIPGTTPAEGAEKQVASVAASVSVNEPGDRIRQNAWRETETGEVMSHG
jgi:hypothetical protein